MTFDCWGGEPSPSLHSCKCCHHILEAYDSLILPRKYSANTRNLGCRFHYFRWIALQYERKKQKGHTFSDADRQLSDQFLIKARTCTEVSLSINFNILFPSVPWDDIMKSVDKILDQYLFHLAAS